MPPKIESARTETKVIPAIVAKEEASAERISSMPWRAY